MQSNKSGHQSLRYKVNQHFGTNLTNVFCKILLQIACFFKLFGVKNAENDYFDQCLECAAPKRWSKYTTHDPPAK